MYYYNDGENEVGPFAISKLKILRENGLIADGTLVRSRDSRAWVPLSELLSETELELPSAESSPEITQNETEVDPVPFTSQPDVVSNIPEVEPRQQIEEIEENDPKTVPIEEEKPEQTEQVAEPEPDKRTTAKVDVVPPKPLQSYDPAYKYIPRDKRTSPKQAVRTTPDPREEADPAYKYIPKNKSISSEATTPVVSETNGPPGWLSAPPTPWRRYAARILDTSLNGGLGFFVFGIAFYAIAPATADDFFSIFEAEGAFLFDVFLTGIMASIIGGALIGVSGFTVGKLIFGIKVVRSDGSNMGLGAGLFRDFEVWIKGMAMGIPIIALFTLWFSYKSLTERRTTSWDEHKYVVYHRPSGGAQYFLNVLGLIAIVLVFGMLGALAEM